MTTNIVSHKADRLLRTALKIDSVVTGLMGLGFVAFGQPNQDHFGLPTALTIPCGIVLLAFASLLWFTSSRQQINLGQVWLIIAVNLAWVLASAGVLITRAVELTSLGKGFVAAQATAVAIFATLEFIGLRRTRTRAFAQTGSLRR